MMRVAMILAVTAGLAACAPTHWAPAPGQSAANFEPTKARCSMVARHGGGGFAAYGSQQYVAGAAMGYAIGEAIRSSQDFSDCMKASGFLPVTKEMVAANHQRSMQFMSARDQHKACLIATRSNPEYAPLLSHLANDTVSSAWNR